MIRVGRCTYGNGTRIDPSFEGFEPILVLNCSHSKWGALGPCLLKNEKGQIMENLWKFSQVHQSIPKTMQRYSRYDSKIIWSHPAETHMLADGTLTPEYFAWREKGMNCKWPVSYPVGFAHRHKCVGFMLDPTPAHCHMLTYIEARREIYLKEYVRLARQQSLYKVLKCKLASGINLLIIEVNGPHQESLSYYQSKYSVAPDFIDGDSMLATQSNLELMLNDGGHAFGHGYALAWALIHDEHFEHFENL